MNYLVYKTINKITNREYIGVHKQSGLEFDGYLGSGYRLKDSIGRHGEDNFTRETLYSFDNKEDAYIRESELVNQEYLDRDDTYNISLGGYGAPSRLNSLESVAKRTKTILDRGYGTSHMTTPEALEKAKLTRKLNGTDQCNHMNTPEIQKIAVINARKSVIKNSHKKYPILNSKVKLLDENGTIMEGTLYEVSKFIYGKGRAVSHHSRLVKLMESGKSFSTGFNKGKRIEILESSTTSALCTYTQVSGSGKHP